MIARWFSKDAVYANRFGLAFCLLVVIGPYWSIMFGPGPTSISQRVLGLGIVIVVDSLALIGIRYVMLPSWPKGRSQWALLLLLIPALTFYFLVAFRNAFAAVLIYSTTFPEMFMATPPGPVVAILMPVGLAFTAYEFLIVGRITK